MSASATQGGHNNFDCYKAQYKSYWSKSACMMYLNFNKAANLYITVALMKQKRKECIVFTNIM